jgi:uncharacterized protein involved in type VI secretion and phage assembly
MSQSTPPAHYADQHFFGVAEALVVDVMDPDRECRVRLRLPWLDSQQETEWCRSTAVFAGNGYGSTWTPEEGDEVLVAFVHGDLRYPVVLGGMFNGQDKPPSARDEQTNAKVFRTKLGHELVFDDSNGSHKVQLTTSDGHRLELDDSGRALSLISKSGHGVSIDDNTGTLKISARVIEIEASTSIKIKAPAVNLNPPA